MYREVAPHPKLRKHIKCFWMLDHDYSRSSHNHERLWADAHTELIFTSGQRYFLKNASRKVSLPASFVIGPFQKELELFSRGRTALVAARFWPWGFHPMSKLPMTELKNSVRSCRHAFASPGEFLEMELAGIAEPEAKIAALEQAFLSGLASNKAKLLSRPMATDILETRGIIRIAELTGKHGIHPRRLQRVFLHEIGLSPKVLARIVRFNHVKRMIERNPEIDLLTLTYDCGYADQAHFTRNFREMFGITPAEFKASMREAFRRFREKKPDVVFVQDGAQQPR